ncbi:uncharacterized protein LOC125038872 [Penaeus chinensis]|uniref:uncharacterized protein LOC125038872 n=1 Tax=Penaeus chinensis TaxID=139456 RepID=UPI001FB5B4FF|nr:uncharacterized protein LOC125038872 [Penaeus chinensis]
MSVTVRTVPDPPPPPPQGLTVVGTFLPSYLPEWPVDNLSLWLSLAEGLLLPLVLGLVDATFSEAAGASCSRDKPQPHKYDDGDGPFRLFPKEEVKSFPLTNGSLFSSLLNMSVDNPAQILPSYRRGGGAGMKMGVSSQEIRGLVAAGPPPRVRDPYGPPFYPREATESLGSAATSSQDPIYSDPLTKVGSVGSSLKEDHIYATLSETFGSMSSLSEGFLGDDQRCSSVTTVANDDFEFHDPRAATPPAPAHLPAHLPARDRGLASACNLALAGRPPAQLPPEALRDEADDAYGLSSGSTSSASLSAASSSFRSASSQVTATVDSSGRGERLHLAKADNRRQSDPDDDDDDDDDDEDDERRDRDEVGFYNTGYECDTLEKKRKALFAEPLGLRAREGDGRDDGTLSRKHRSSSLSMNDLDRLDDKEEEMMFILPVKSESMLSLYRLYLAEDEAEGASLHYSVEISRSEGDLSLAAGVGPAGVGVGEGKSEGALHEVYQKRRAPEAGGSRVKLQHKIQRAKGMQQRARRPPAPPLAVSSAGVGAGMQVAIMDKARRRNGIITIQDPSGLSVEELFRVLDRASAKKAVPYAADPAAPPPPPPQTSDFKKIFVSEYL